MSRALVVVLAAALVLRLGALAVTHDYVPSGDAADFDRHAQSLVHAGTFAPTQYADPLGASAYRPPLYPLVVAGVDQATGTRLWGARLAGVALGVVAVWLVWLLAGGTAAWLAALAPPLVFLPVSLLSENLFVPLALGVALALVRFRATRSLRWAAAAGVLVGLAALTRSNGIVLAPALVAGLWSPRALAVALGCLAVALVPWTVRNQASFDALLPLGTQAGYTLAGVYNSQAAMPGDLHAAFRVPQTLPEYAGLFGRPGYQEDEVGGELRARASHFARHHPGYVAEVLGLDALRLADLGPGHVFVSGVSYHEMGIPHGWRWLVRLGTWLLLAGALAGLVLARGRTGLPWVAWLVPALLVLSLLPTSGLPRYRVAIDPFLCVLAARSIRSNLG